MAPSPQRANTGGGSKPDRFEDYVPVAERLEKFYERFPDGRMITHILEHNSETGFVLIRAEAYRNPDDAQPAATGHAFEVRGESFVNKTSYIENCETGACARVPAQARAVEEEVPARRPVAGEQLQRRDARRSDHGAHSGRWRMNAIKCPHCNEELEPIEPISGFSGEDGEIIEEPGSCHWCEKDINVKWKANVSFEVVEVTG